MRKELSLHPYFKCLIQKFNWLSNEIFVLNIAHGGTKDNADRHWVPEKGENGPPINCNHGGWYMGRPDGPTVVGKQHDTIMGPNFFLHKVNQDRPLLHNQGHIKLGQAAWKYFLLSMVLPMRIWMYKLFGAWCFCGNFKKLCMSHTNVNR